MTWGLDTSVAVRLLVGEPARQAEAAKRTLGEADGVEVSDLVVGECYFALRHQYRVPHAAAVAALKALLDDPRVHATGVSRKVFHAGGIAGDVPGVMDRLIHADYEQSGARLLTFDRDAARLGGAKLLD